VEAAALQVAQGVAEAPAAQRADRLQEAEAQRARRARALPAPGVRASVVSLQAPPMQAA
jgi:hypothetical protein